MKLPTPDEVLAEWDTRPWFNLEIVASDHPICVLLEALREVIRQRDAALASNQKLLKEADLRYATLEERRSACDRAEKERDEARVALEFYAAYHRHDGMDLEALAVLKAKEEEK